MRTFWLAITVLFVGTAKGMAGWSHADDSIFRLRVEMALAQHIDTLSAGPGPAISGEGTEMPGPEIAAAGMLLLGTPYVAGTLDSDVSAERLVIDLRGFDCVTFYENSLALAWAVKKTHVERYNSGGKSAPDEAAFDSALTRLRYRGGVCNGYHSRLHYTIDYFYDNDLRGNLLNVTARIGGRYLQHDSRTINFMTSHRTAYKQLEQSDSEFEAMEQIEQSIHDRGPFAFIPKEHIAAIEGGIQTGDVLGITTNIAGLDCSHTGIAIRMKDGRIHFMHASSLQGKVIVSEEPLADYLTHSAHQTGIIIARPVVPRLYLD